MRAQVLGSLSPSWGDLNGARSSWLQFGPTVADKWGINRKILFHCLVFGWDFLVVFV